MKAWRFDNFGDIANFTLRDVAEPEPAADEVLVRLKFAALNPADRLLVEGLYPGAGKLPLTVGRDGAGVIERAPEGSRYRLGDQVVILRSEIGISRQGTLAEFVAAPEAVVAPLPEGWSLEEGAAAPLVYLTAWKALVTQGNLRAPENVLVTGASGGVGIAAVQLASALGATVVALSRDAGKREQLVRIGARAAVDSDAGDLEQQVGDAFGGGADLVIDNLAGPFMQKYLNMANLNARVMVIGLLAGRAAEIQLGLLLFKQTRIEGVHVGKFSPTEAQSAWASIVETLERAEARPLIEKVFPMDQVQEAFAHLRGGHLGKVLVDVASLAD